MGDSNGWEICKTIKEDPSYHSVTVCMLSSHYTEEAMQRSFGYAHADEHLPKPIILDEFKKTVTALLNT